MDATGKQYDKRRKAIRETWLPQIHDIAEIEVAFIAGELQDSSAQAKLMHEAEQHKDFIFLDMKVRRTAPQHAA